MSNRLFLSILTLAALPLCAQQAGPYRDPQGRFAVDVPAGWSAMALSQDSVYLTADSAYAALLVLAGDNSRTAVDAKSRELAEQWRNFAEVRRGDVRLAGRAGVYVTCSGLNPKGVDAYIEVMGVVDRGRVFVLMMSAPKAGFGKFKPAFDQVEQSLAIQAQVVTAPPPMAAGAVPAASRQVNAGAAPPAASSWTPLTETSGAASSPASNPGGTGKPNFYHMKKVSVMDEHGFERPMPALSLLVPTDWQFQGQTKFQNTFGGCHENMVQVSFRAASADQRLGLEMFPDYVWTWLDDPGMRQMAQASSRQAAQFGGGRPCEVMPAMAAADYLRRVVIPRERPKAQILGAEPLPDVLQEAQKQAHSYEQQAAQMGMRTRIQADAARVRVQYTLNGAAVEEWFTAITFAVATPAPSFNIQTGRAGQTLSYNNGAYMVMAMRAPQGQLAANEKFFDTIRATIHAEPQWNARVQQAEMNMSASDGQAAMARSKIIAQSGKETSDIINKGWEERSKVRDAAIEKFDQYIRGVATYRNPNTGETFELPYYNNHAWVNGSGTEYIVSDSGTFNPNSAVGGSWTQVYPVK